MYGSQKLSFPSSFCFATKKQSKACGGTASENFSEKPARAFSTEMLQTWGHLRSSVSGSMSVVVMRDEPDASPAVDASASLALDQAEGLPCVP